MLWTAKAEKEEGLTAFWEPWLGLTIERVSELPWCLAVDLHSFE